PKPFYLPDFPAIFYVHYKPDPLDRNFFCNRSRFHFSQKTTNGMEGFSFSFPSNYKILFVVRWSLMYWIDFGSLEVFLLYRAKYTENFEAIVSILFNINVQFF